MLYAARTVMPMCVVTVSEEMDWDKTESVSTQSDVVIQTTLVLFCFFNLSDHFEGSRPERCISSMIYSGDAPLWSETLDFIYAI